MAELKFYRGIKAKYSEEEHRDGIYFATDKHEIILNGESYGLEVDDELLSNSTNPVSGSAVYKAIEDMIKGSIDSTLIGNSLKLNSEGNARSISLIDSRTNTVLSTTDEWAVSSDEINKSGLQLDFLTKELSVKSGQSAVVRFKHDVYNSQNVSLGADAECVVEICTQNGSLKKKIEFTSKAGLVNEVDVTSELEEGSYILIKVRVTSNTPDFGEQTKSGQIKAFLVNLQLSSPYNIATRTLRGKNIEVLFNIKGLENSYKEVNCYIDGVKHSTSSVISSGSFIIPTSSLSHGSHSIQIKAEVLIGDNRVSSNSLYLGAIIYEEGNKTPIIVVKIDYEDGRIVSGNPQFDIEQYDSYELAYAIYDPELINARVDFYSEGELLDSGEIDSSSNIFKYRYTVAGIKKCSIKSKSVEFIYYVNVSQSSFLVEEYRNGLKLYLSAYAKSNNSSSKDNWSYEGITTSFENVLFGSDGWTGDSLRLMNGGRAIINFQPFSQDTPNLERTNAFSFNIRFKTSNVSDEDETLISCLDEEGIGFKITGQEARYTAAGGTTISTKFASGQIYDIGFVAFPKTEDENTLMMYLYVNGIICGVIQRGEGESIFQDKPSKIILSANRCILDVYSIRYYNTALNDNNVFSNYLIDLGDSDSFRSEYNSNDVLDMNGNISVSSVCGKIPYFIITGMQDSGVATFHHAAIINNKSTKYPVESILYVEGEQSPRNFIVVRNPENGANPIIQLQGTSSLSYPRKNYKFIFKDKDSRGKSIYPLMYMGCDPNGGGDDKILQEKPLFSLTANSVPVHTFCAKADFAESSSTHNTGTANLVHEVLSNAKDLTPPQIYKDPSYPYDIRTTVEGYPCLVFYRATKADTPVFAGKYNFNNDKSTEDVFGFLDIPGYHKNSQFEEKLKKLAEDSIIFPEEFTSVSVKEGDTDVIYTKQDIIDLLDNNPTECWEFKTNDIALGEFTVYDFDCPGIKEKYLWLDMWEARFPDEDALNEAFNAGAKPKYLTRVSKWINDTYTDAATGESLLSPVTYDGITYYKDSAEYRASKFKHELKDYFNVNFLCDYYVITDCLAAVDQRVKNMMWAFWYNPDSDYSDVGGGDGVLCYPIFYDSDTILGIRNDGKNKFNWDVDENTLDPDDPKQHAFMGHNSVLWRNLRDYLPNELNAAYKRLRENNMTNDKLFRYYNEEQSDKFCERIYNKDSLYKYVIPATVGVEINESGSTHLKKYNYELSAQGDRKSHRQWFITNRMDYFDAKHSLTSGSSQMTLKALNTVVDPEKDSQILKLTSARDYFISVQIESTGVPKPFEVKKDEEWTYKYELTQNIGTVFYFSGLKWVKKLDMSNWKGISEMNLPVLDVIEEVIFGNRDLDNTTLGKLPISGDNVPSAKRIVVNNLKNSGITSFNFSKCIYLEYLDMRGCDNLTSGSFAENSNIKEVYLPKKFESLKLISLPELTIDNIYFENPTSVTELWVENCRKIDGVKYLDKLISQGNRLRYVRLTGLNLSGNGQDLIKYKKSVVTCELVGTYQLTTLLEESVFEELRKYFTELIIEQPKYTTYIFNNLSKDPEKITNLDNSSGFGEETEYVPSGHIKKILDQRHSYLVKSVLENKPGFESGKRVFVASRLSDTNSNYFYGNEISSDLSGDNGDFCMYEPHYWYKGVNDHLNKKIFAFYSSNAEVPTVSQGIKIETSELILKKNHAVIATGLSTDVQALVPEVGYNSYKYILPENHNFFRIRVTCVASEMFGAIACDSKGNVLKNYICSESNGMFTGSYLWFEITKETKFIWFTTSSAEEYSITPYLVYVTPSRDIEDLEPDWVEHRESFVGRILSTPYNKTTKSAFINTDNYFYSTEESKSPPAELFKTIERRGNGYYPFDYETYKEIMLLGYLNYGTTYLQDKVGRGRLSPYSQSPWNRINRYFPMLSVYTEYSGERDTEKIELTGTESNGTLGTDKYVSVYKISSEVSKFPGVSTLMGYHQLIGGGGTISSNDFVDRATMVLKTPTRKIKIFSKKSYRYNNYIQGGRYIDILGIGDNNPSNIFENTGYCSSEFVESNTSSTAGYLVCGYQSYSGTTNAASCFRVTADTTSSMSISSNDFDKVLRVMIIPDKILFVDPEDFNNY